MNEQLSPELVVQGYCLGAFPMARSRTGGIDWYRPDPRTILPLDRFHVPRSLTKRVRSGRFQVTRDAAFERVIRGCAGPRPNHDGTWISQAIIDVYTRLHHRGIAHSVEAWLSPPPRGAPPPEASRPGTQSPAASHAAVPGEPELAGGLYGVALGGAFFGESMYSRATDASKVCLVHLVAHLRARGYILLDVQFTNPHLARFGVEEIPGEEYLRRLHEALALDVSWE